MPVTYVVEKGTGGKGQQAVDVEAAE